jgi:hypothetical protein
MIWRTKFAAVLAVAAAMVGIVVGTAGAAGSAPAASKPAVRSAASRAAAERGALLRHADFTTVAGAAAYFRTIGVDPRGLVIQRGARNYAGPNCPGAGWACVSTAHPVVQIAGVGGKNTFFCTSGRCAVVQLTARGAARSGRSLTASAPTNPNIAQCIKTTGLGQTCSISQSSGTANNQAAVYESTPGPLGKTTGLTQTASFMASITQQETGGPSNSHSNTACVYQVISMDGSTNTSGKKGVGATVTLEAHQTVTINQDTFGSGTNNANQTANSTNTNNGCNQADATGLLQSQTLTSTASASGPIVQNENAANGGPNVFLDVEQNQLSGNGVATGAGNVLFTQTNSLTALASTSATSGSTSCPTVVCQMQSSLASGSIPAGGILAKVNQYSTGVLMANANQQETQCEDAVAPPSTPVCPTPADPPTSYTPMQAQYGPIGSMGGPSVKGQRTLAKTGKDAPSVQSGGNPDDRFMITQISTQSNDTQNSSTQKNDVEAVCQTPGDCTATQTTTVNGTSTTNTQTGQNVSTTTTCSGSTCTAPPPAIVFDGSPRTNVPPSTLGPYNMTKFGTDPQPVCTDSGSSVTGVTDPAGTISFDEALSHDHVGGCWATWSNGYTGDVYDTSHGAADATQVTITLPVGTNAFYFYAEPQQFAVLHITATAQDGTTSGPLEVNGEGGAQYFGFYGTGGDTVASITVTTDDPTGFAVGEFGINTTQQVIG